MMPSHPPAQPARYDSTPALARTDHAPWRALRSPEAPQRSHTTCCCRVHTLLLSAPRTGCPSTCHRSLRMPTPTHNAMPPAQNTPPRTHLHRPHRIPRALSAQTPRLRRHPCLDTPSRTLWRLALHRPSATRRPDAGPRHTRTHAPTPTHAAALTHQHCHLHAGTTHARTQPDTRRGNLQPALAVTPCRGTTHPRTHTAAPTHQRRLLHPRTRGSGGPMPSRVAVGPAQGRAVAAGAGLQRCDRGLPWAAIACGSAAAYCYCEGPCYCTDPCDCTYKKEIAKISNSVHPIPGGGIG